jgi:hypothetical protein
VLDQLGDAALGQTEQLVEHRAAERGALGRSLELHVAALRRHHHVHVDVSGGVLRVGQVAHRDATDHADADRRAEGGERVRLEVAGGDAAGERVVQGEVAARDCGGAGTAVGLQHVAVDHHLALAQHPHVAHRPQRPADEPLDLLGAAALASLGRFPVDPLGARPGQHRVLGGHPPGAAALHPARHVVVDGGGAQHRGLAHRDQAGAVGHDGEVALEADRPQLVGRTAVLALVLGGGGHRWGDPPAW